MSALRFIPCAFSVLFCMAIGYYVRGCSIPEPATEYVYVPQPAPSRPIGASTLTPVTVELYELRTDTVTYCAPVLEDDTFSPHAVIQEDYAYRRGGRLYIEKWVPDSLRYVRDIYDVGLATWAFGVSLESRAFLGRDTALLTHAAGLAVRYRALTVTGGVGAFTGAWGTDYGPMVSVRFNPMWSP